MVISSAYDDTSGLVLEVRVVPPFLPSMDVGNVELGCQLVSMCRPTSMYGTDTPSKASRMATL